MSDAGAAGEASAEVRRARTLIYTQVGLAALGILLLILGAAAATEEQREEARRAAEKVSAAEGAVNSLLGLATLAAIVVLLISANKLLRLAPSARRNVLVAEGILIVAGVWGLRSLDPAAIIFNAIALGLAGWVIFLLTRPEVASAFSQPPDDRRFDVEL